LNGQFQFNSAHKFNGVIWNTLAIPENEVILLEVRNHEQKRVSFSAFNYKANSFLWQEKTLEEPWWVNLSVASKGVIIFTIYIGTNNPDKKGIIAYTLNNLQIKWWSNDFSLTGLSGDKVYGINTNLGFKSQVLDLQTGKECQNTPFEQESKKVNEVIRPVQYAEGMPYFDQVKRFLIGKLNLLPVVSLEYIEYNSCIFVSCYVEEGGLANYLLILSENGEELLKEKIGEQLQGVGLDTFFILDEYLFFVKNKLELVSFKL